MVAQLLVGSSKLLAERGDPAGLRAMVTSPGGTTAAGVRVLEERATRAAFIDAVVAATERSRAWAVPREHEPDVAGIDARDNSCCDTFLIEGVMPYSDER